jgi:hypothetical protein
MRLSLFAALVLALSCSHPQKPAEAAPQKPEAAAPAQPAAAPASAAPAPASAPEPAPDRSWIPRSDENARLLLAVQARFAPEFAARQGVAGIDDQVADFAPGHVQRQRDAVREVQAQLEQRQKEEKDPQVAQDLAILVDAAKRQIEGFELRERLQVPYYNLPRLVFGSVRALLDKQIAPERRPAALVRVRKYAGLEGGRKPLVELAEAETRAGLKKKLLAPSRIEIENDLETAQPLLDGFAKLFKEFQVEGSDQAVARLRKQLDGYLQFVRKEVLPKARDDFRLPPELYAYSLRQFGVDIPPDELVRQAKQAFNEYQGEMKTVAARIAEKRHLPSPDYRDVIKELKKDQIPDDKVLAFYQQRLAEIE